MAMDHDFPSDVMAEILLRLPPSSRRRARLVCRLWRDVVNARTTELQSRPKLLLWRVDKAVAYVSSDLSSPSPTGSCTELWRYSEPGRRFYGELQPIGTCNGLLCLCDNTKGVGGTLTLLNPATGEKLPVLPLPCAGSFIGTHGWIRWGDAYSFAYHPMTGHYKLVHVPCTYDRVCEFNAVHVLTLGEAAWREVAVDPGDAITRLGACIVSVDGTTYWVRVTGGGAAKIVSFDLKDERVVSTSISMPLRCDQYRLTEMHGRLGFVAWPNVWALEKDGQGWSRRYNFGQPIPWPHFVYGEYILTCEGLSYYRHNMPSSGRTTTGNEVVRVGHWDKGTLIANMAPREGSSYRYYEAFAYVETTEPLGVYATN